MFLRTKYLNQLLELKDNSRVKIITGIRRCGKSFLLNKIFKEHLISNGVKSDHIIYLELDDFNNNYLLNPISLNDYVKNQITDDDKYYLIIDEIQKVIPIINPILTNGKIVKASNKDEDVINFTTIVLGLLKIENIDIYITGSNSKFLSSEIMTEFRDRGDEIHIMPLTFKEYCEGLNITEYEKAFGEYLIYGGMPLAATYDNVERKEKYLNDLFSLTYHKDVEEHNGIKNIHELELLTKVLASNVGNLTNYITITNTFNSELRINISKDTINDYIKYLSDAFIISRVDRVDVRGRKHIGAQYKYYFVDNGLRNSRLDFLHHDYGHVMENIIYNELKCRGYTVEIGVVEVYSKNKEGKTIRQHYETDFVASKGNNKYYIQSAYSIYDEQKYEQERKSLINIKDSFKKIIITRESLPMRRDEKGIVIMGIIDFLLDDNSLNK